MVYLLGMAMILIGIFGAVHGFRQKALLSPVSGWTRTVGTVQSVSTHCDRGCVYAAKVNYADEHGTEHWFTAPNADSPPAVGAPIDVEYNPVAPDDAHDLSASGSNWTFEIATMIFMGAMGLALLGFGTWVRRRAASACGMPIPATRGSCGSVAVGQAFGFATSASCLGVIAGVVGAIHVAAWVLLPAAVGVGGSIWQLARVRGRQRRYGGATLASWWRQRGLWQMLAVGVPAYVALAVDAVKLAKH